MGRKSKPYWWEAKQGYYSKVNGKRYRLGDTKREAEEALKILQKAPAKVLVDSEAVASLFDSFLDWTQQNRAPKTYRGYLDFCQSFKNKWPRLRIADLQPIHVTQWLDEQKTWNSTTKRNGITCIQRVINWGTKNWNLEKNPLHRMEKPEAQRREQIISPAEFKDLLAAIPDAEFRELLIVSNESGARPQEVKNLEARHVDLKAHIWYFPKEEAKGKKRARTVYMTQKALAIVRKRVKERPTGKLFLNTRGKPWTAGAVKDRFMRLEETLGVRYCQYMLRHRWITAKIVAGVDSHVVATLAGHSNTAMLDKHYSKIAADHKFLLKEAKR